MPADKNTRERTEGATTAVQEIDGDSFSVNQGDPNPKRSTSFGYDSTGSPDLLCSRDDALVGNSAAALKPCPSTQAMRSPTAAGGLLPTDKASTVTRTTFDQPPLWF